MSTGSRIVLSIAKRGPPEKTRTGIWYYNGVLTCRFAMPQQRRYRNVGLGISLGLAAFLIVVDQVES